MPALAWCYSDYAPPLWALPPLKQNIHERYFGLFLHDGSPKKQLQAFHPSNWQDLRGGSQDNWSWLEDFDPDNFYIDPPQQLTAMFAAYHNALTTGGLS